MFFAAASNANKAGNIARQHLRKETKRLENLGLIDKPQKSPCKTTSKRNSFATYSRSDSSAGSESGSAGFTIIQAVSKDDIYKAESIKCVKDAIKEQKVRLEDARVRAIESGKLCLSRSDSQPLALSISIKSFRRRVALFKHLEKNVLYSLRELLDEVSQPPIQRVAVIRPLVEKIIESRPEAEAEVRSEELVKEFSLEMTKRVLKELEK